MWTDIPSLQRTQIIMYYRHTLYFSKHGTRIAECTLYSLSVFLLPLLLILPLWGNRVQIEKAENRMERMDERREDN